MHQHSPRRLQVDHVNLSAHHPRQLPGHLQAPLETLHRVHPAPEQHGHVGVAPEAGLPARPGAEEVGGSHIGTAGQVAAQGLNRDIPSKSVRHPAPPQDTPGAASSYARTDSLIANTPSAEAARTVATKDLKPLPYGTLATAVLTKKGCRKPLVLTMGTRRPDFMV